MIRSLTDKILKNTLGKLGPVELLVLQPSPFCNLNCTYCYLPFRDNKERMSVEVLQAIFQKVFNSPLAKDRITIVWHAGEPLALPISFYKEAFALAEECKPEGLEVRHSFQTNATLINDAWCEFFLANKNVHVGVSVDGPEFIHNQKRKSRTGQGTHHLTLRGIHKLQEHGIGFSVISVLSSTSLDHVHDMFDFYDRNDILNLGFNVEESEGSHQSSLQNGDHSERLSRFYSKFYDLVKASPKNFQVREFPAINPSSYPPSAPEARSYRIPLQPRGNQENLPMKLLTIGVKGEISTFSPELLGLPNDRFNSFVFGNILTDELTDVLQDQVFLDAHSEIQAGIRACENECPYYKRCLGGSPSEKIGESGSFAVSKTRGCELKRKVLLNVLDQKLREELRITKAQ